MAIDLTPIGVPGSSYDDFGLKTSSTSVTLEGVSANVNRGDIHVRRIVDAFSDLGPSARPTGLYTFANQITVELDGTQATVSYGDLAVVGDGLDILTGQVGTTTLGDITASIPLTLTLAGVSGTGTLGGLTLNFDYTEIITGVEGTGTVGAIVTGVIPDGVEGSGALGSLTIVTNTNYELTGLEATAPDTAVTPLTDQVIPITADGASAELGAVTAIGTPAVRAPYTELSPSGTPGGTYTFVEVVSTIVPITGVEASAPAALFLAATLQQEPDGIQATGAADDVNTTQGQTEELSGTVGTTTLGTLAIPETVVLVGTQSNALLGGISAQGDDVSIELGGLEANSALGTMALSVDSVVSIAGVESTGETSVPVFDLIIGVEGTTGLGTLTDTQGVTLTLQGVNTRAISGHIVGTRTDQVFPLYFKVAFDTDARYHSATMRNWTVIDASMGIEPLRAQVEMRHQVTYRVEIENVVATAVLMEAA